MTKPLIIKPQLSGYSSAVEDFVNNSLANAETCNQESGTDWEEEEYPSCTLHSEYFTYALHLLEKSSNSSQFSSPTWDTREMFRSIQKQ